MLLTHDQSSILHHTALDDHQTMSKCSLPGTFSNIVH